MRRDTSEQAESDRGGQEVEKITLLFDRKDLLALRDARARLWRARRHCEEYHQLGFVVLGPELADAVAYATCLMDRIMECHDGW